MPIETTTEPAAQPIPAAVIAGCLCINIAVALWVVVARPALNVDFRGPWSFANFARHQNLALIYQAAPLQVFQHQIYPRFQSFSRFNTRHLSCCRSGGWVISVIRRR